MTNTKAQLSYEYIIIMGMILVLVAPIFYYTFTSAATDLGSVSLGDAANYLQYTSETVSQLSQTSKYTIRAEITSTPSETTIGGTEISFKLPSGEILHVEPLGVQRLISGATTLTEKGIKNVAVEQLENHGVSITETGEPALACIEKGKIRYYNECDTLVTVNANDDIELRGVNFEPTSTVNAKRTGGPPVPLGQEKFVLDPEDVTYQTDKLINVNVDLSKGNYNFEVENTNGLTSEILPLRVV